jgi:hypothetical protein
LNSTRSLAHRQRLLRADQRGFEDALGIRRIHGLVVSEGASRGAVLACFSVAARPSTGAHAACRAAAIQAAAGWLVSHSVHCNAGPTRPGAAQSAAAAPELSAAP